MAKSLFRNATQGQKSASLGLYLVKNVRLSAAKAVLYPQIAPFPCLVLDSRTSSKLRLVWAGKGVGLPPTARPFRRLR